MAQDARLGPGPTQPTDDMSDIPSEPSEPSEPETRHTFVVSDFHQADAQPLDPKRPLWKRFKGRDLFTDDSFERFLDHLRDLGEGEIELVLNGDIFDFDSVMAIPDEPTFHVRWLERKRGLRAEEAKSLFKMSVIINDHPVFFRALRTFLLDGHHVIIVMGNHDIELQWPVVQAAVRDALDLPEERQAGLRFCEWFYISGGDTLVEHGNQYDRYCVCINPVSPTVHVHAQDVLRLPFGNIAERYMLNGMGLFNPHVESSFIRSFKEYLIFFGRYMLRVQPLIVWTWFWSAMVTMIVSVREGLLPALHDPFALEERVDGIADRANATPGQVRGLQAMRVHPAVHNPLLILRELWLDRALAFAALLFGTFWLFTLLNVFIVTSIWVWAVFFVLTLPLFIFYARGVNSDVRNYERGLRVSLPKVARLLKVERVIMGHTHLEHHVDIAGVDVLNTGTWSPAYRDVECTEPHGRKCFAWVRPGEDGRVADLMEWTDPGSQVIAPTDE